MPDLYLKIPIYDKPQRRCGRSKTSMYLMPDFYGNECDAGFRLDEALFPVGKLVGFEVMLLAKGQLGHTAGSPAFDLPFPIGSLPL